MVILDADSGTIVATAPIGRGVDGGMFDRSTGLAFSSNGEGTMTVVQQVSAGKYLPAGTLPTRPGARTLVLDEKSHQIYTVAGRYGPPPAPTADRPHPRPPIEPGSAMLYVIGR
jgi:hypothetical protein